VAIVLPKFSRRRPSTGLAAETQPAVNLTLCREDGLYEAGGTLTVKWRISRVPLDEVQGIELSVLWHTEGKGDEDLHVHHFHRVVESQVRRVGLADEQSIGCVLPATPLSYHGQLISLQWCVRMRLFLIGGRGIVAEQPFHLVSSEMVAPYTIASDRPSVALRNSDRTLAGPTDVTDHSSASS
jgi:hypothetical protein